MSFLRKFALVIVTPIFMVLLLAAASDMSVLRIVSQPTNVKQVLADSGIYKTAVNSLLDQAKQQTSDQGSVDLTNPTIEAAANATFTPKYIQTNVENVIDSVYAWLNGKTAQPQFSIDLGGLKEKFANAAGQAGAQRAASLPACTDVASAAASQNDPISATCLPPGVTPAAVASEVEGNILSGKGFLNNTVITANSIKGQNSNQSIFADQLKNAPKQYQRVKETPIILSAAALLVAILVVFLSASRRAGLRHVGVVLLIVGLLMLLFAWGLNQAAVKEVPKIKLNNAVVQSDIHRIIIDLEQKIDQNYWIFGAVYGALGVLAIAAAVFWPGAKGKGKSKDDLEGEGRTADDRIDLKAPDKATELEEPKTTKVRTSTPHVATKPASPVKGPKKNIQIKDN